VSAATTVPTTVPFGEMFHHFQPCRQRRTRDKTGHGIISDARVIAEAVRHWIVPARAGDAEGVSPAGRFVEIDADRVVCGLLLAMTVSVASASVTFIARFPQSPTGLASNTICPPVVVN